jgi:fucose permease
MVPLLAVLNKSSTVKLVEVGFLLILFAGIWFVASEIPQLKMQRARGIVAGLALAVAGLLLIIAAHYGKLV